MDKILFKKLPLKEGKRYVIGDIHGCYKSLQALLEKLAPNKEDELIFLGDYIDRGPNSSGVIDLLLELSEQLNCHFLRGNHEQMLLDAYQKGGEHVEHQLRRLSGLDLIQSGKLKESHVHFMKQSLHYVISGNFLMVHAGIAEHHWQEDEQAMLWIRDFAVPVNFPYTVVHGHVPSSLKTIERHVEQVDLKKIPLDGGCVYKNSLAELGYLCALELNERRLFSVPCSDF